MESAPLPDARPLNWVDRHAPEALKPWLKLGRFDRPIGIWLLLIPCWQGIALFYASSDTAFGEFGLWLVAAFAGGAVLMRAAGCAFNDVVDRDIDRQVARTADRPVAAGRISVKQALAFIAACCLISFLLLLTMNAVTLGLAMASLALVAAYPFMKRITWWPQAWLGLTFNWGALMGFAARVPGLGFLESIAANPNIATGGVLSVLLCVGVAYTELESIETNRARAGQRPLILLGFLFRKVRALEEKLNLWGAKAE